MTNPPMNWGYARGDDGFFHVLSRGQFDSFRPTADFGEFIWQYGAYFKDAVFDLGPWYFAAAAVPFLWFGRASKLMRRWVVGILLMWIFVSAQCVMALNIEPRELSQYRSLFGPANALLLILAGNGVIVVAGICARGPE